MSRRNRVLLWLCWTAMWAVLIVLTASGCNGVRPNGMQYAALTAANARIQDANEACQAGELQACGAAIEDANDALRDLARAAMNPDHRASLTQNRALAITYARGLPDTGKIRIRCAQLARIVETWVLRADGKPATPR